MVDVFVSYSSQDRDRVQGLVREIEAIGCSVWWDRQIGAGAAFDREIERAIDEAHCIVVVWSHNSVESEWVRTEANEGLIKGNLVPVAIEAIKPPLAFRRIQTIDFTAPDASASLVTAIAKLLPATASSEGLPCVGRTREIGRLGEAIERARGGDGGLLLFSGEAGVGKTRMTLEAERMARDAGLLVLRGHCPDVDSAPPYQPLLEQIERLARLIGPEVMRQRLGENATELGKLMPELHQRYGDIPPYPTLPPEQERRYLLHGVGEFVARGGKIMPLMLVFEDLHWADESTCILLRYLTERLKDEPVLLVGTYRDVELAPGGPFGRVLQELTRERLAEDLRLGRLSRAEIVELLVRRFGSQPPAALVELVFSETEGNPFFIDEVVRHLHETGKLLTEAGKFRETIEIADTEVARGVRLIIEDRIGRAGALCREILSTAAVAGRAFAFDLLVKADSKHDDDDILDAIEEAERKRLIEDISRDRIARYQFVHEQIRQTLLAGLSFPRRQRLHLRIADALEAIHAGDAEKFASEIGHHLYQAGSAAEPGRTAHHLGLAGQRAMDALAFEDGLRQFDLALGVLAEGDAATLARLQGLRSEALRGAERITESLQALNLAVALAPTQASKDDFTLQRCRMLLDLWRGDEAGADLEDLQERARDGGDAGRELEVQRAVARAYYVMSLDHAGFAEKCKAAHERTIELARAQGATKTLCQTLIAIAQLVDYWPDYVAQARANLDEAQTLARELGDEELDLDVASARMGALGREALAVQGEALIARLVARRDPFRLNAHYFRMMWAMLLSRRFERCLEICDAGTELAIRIGTPPVQYPTIKALALMELGRFGDAWQTLDREVADEAHRFGAALQALGRLQYEVNVGDYEAALDRAPHVIAESRQLARAWMLQWTCDSLAGLAPIHAGDAATLARIDALIADTGSSPAVTSRAALALARGDLLAAREDLTTPRPGPARVILLNADIIRPRLLAAVEAAEDRWGPASKAMGEAIDLARESNSRQQLWRLLGEAARIEEALGQSDAASATRVEARALMAEIAATIPDPRHRSRFLDGRLARQLGLVA
jgi:tetratricopeptide (TPR) repeat protein